MCAAIRARRHRRARSAGRRRRCHLVPLRVQARSSTKVSRPCRRPIHDIAGWFECLLGLVGVVAMATAFRYYFVSWLGERTVADIRLAVHRTCCACPPASSRRTVPPRSLRGSRSTRRSSNRSSAPRSPSRSAMPCMALACIVILFALAAEACAPDASLGVAGPRPPSPSSAGGVRAISTRSQDRIANVGDRNQRGPRRDEDRPGLQPAGSRGDALRGRRSRACSRPPSAGSSSAHHYRDRDLHHLRIDHRGHLARARSKSRRVG